MIIEDDLSLSSLLKEYVKSLGHSVVMNYNPVSALRVLKSEKFDVLLTDVNMSPIDGYEMIYEVRSFNPKIKIIAMSGSFLDNQKCVESASKSLINEGADIFMLKPFTMAELEINLDKLMSSTKAS